MRLLSGLIHTAVLLFCLGSGYLASGQQALPSVALNQVGFRPDDPKRAAFCHWTQNDFVVLRLPQRDTVFRGRLGAPLSEVVSPIRTRMADFSQLQQTGQFIVISGRDSSPVFSIQPQVYTQLLRASIKAYYYQRSGQRLSRLYAGAWARAGGTPDTQVYVHPSAAGPERSAFSTIRAPGGWYDAGDYNEYVVNSGITLGTLMQAWQVYQPLLSRLSTGIPHPDPGVPDFLEELLYELRWMQHMQDPADGGVYHKLTEAHFCGMVMPNQDTLRRYVVAKSTAAALDFAAVMAQAEQVFRPYSYELPGFADSCLKASERAWDWAQLHPAVFYEQTRMNERYAPSITTGSYEDRDLRDERCWAASELYVSTGADRYTPFLPQTADSLQVPSWSEVTLMGVVGLLDHAPRVRLTSSYRDSLQDRLLQLGHALMRGYTQRAFQTVMGASPRDFVWGSNAGAANEGFVLLECFRLTQDPAFLNAAYSNLNYLLGRNALGYCFVTGFGQRSPRHPHHRPSVADGIQAPVPGFLVGGPNPGQQDGRTDYPSKKPDLSYVDDDQAYACNEVAINWNAPLVYLLSGLISSQLSHASP